MANETDKPRRGAQTCKPSKVGFLLLELASLIKVSFNQMLPPQILVLGPYGCGKSALVRRLMEDTYEERSPATICK